MDRIKRKLPISQDDVKIHLKTLTRATLDVAELRKNIEFYKLGINLQKEFGTNGDGFDAEMCHYHIAAAYFQLRDFNTSISHATDGLKLSENNTLLLFIRARAYQETNKYYLAVKDCMQACDLENFKLKNFNELLGDLITQIDSMPNVNHGHQAFRELSVIQYVNKSLWDEIVSMWKRCQMYIVDTYKGFDFDDEAIQGGFLTAIDLLYDDQFMDIVECLDLEINIQGKYAEQAVLLRTLMHSQVYKRNFNMKSKLKTDLKKINQILRRRTLNAKFRLWLRLAKASAYYALKQFKDGDKEFDALTAEFPDNGMIQFWRGYENCTVDTGDRLCIGLKYLQVAVAAMPTFFLADFNTVVFHMAVNKSPESINVYFNDLKRLIKQYPDEINPLIFAIGLLVQMKLYKRAAKYIRRNITLFRTHRGIVLIPDVTDVDLVTDYLEGLIRFDCCDYGAYSHLYEIYSGETQELGKCLEVLNKSLESIHDLRLYEKLYIKRLDFLRTMSEMNLWDSIYDDDDPSDQ